VDRSIPFWNSFWVLTLFSQGPVRGP
jgi:hypothetical protein